MTKTKSIGNVTPHTSDVITGLIIFLSINFLVAAMYHHIINP
ncbi:MAG: photosystem I protein PsaX [Scytolyngbya sp. HA4215-MV1]|nr:photosystem I protein PsaX [Scytolyngbya sp. HA4215-MV1]